MNYNMNQMNSKNNMNNMGHMDHMNSNNKMTNMSQRFNNSFNMNENNNYANDQSQTLNILSSAPERLNNFYGNNSTYNGNNQGSNMNYSDNFLSYSAPGQRPQNNYNNYQGNIDPTINARFTNRMDEADVNQSYPENRMKNNDAMVLEEDFNSILQISDSNPQQIQQNMQIRDGHPKQIQPNILINTVNLHDGGTLNAYAPHGGTLNAYAPRAFSFSSAEKNPENSNHFQSAINHYQENYKFGSNCSTPNMNNMRRSTSEMRNTVAMRNTGRRNESVQLTPKASTKYSLIDNYGTRKKVNYSQNNRFSNFEHPYGNP